MFKHTCNATDWQKLQDFRRSYNVCRECLDDFRISSIGLSRPHLLQYIQGFADWSIKKTNKNIFYLSKLR